jgi:hypothetical protein
MKSRWYFNSNKNKDNIVGIQTETNTYLSPDTYKSNIN